MLDDQILQSAGLDPSTVIRWEHVRESLENLSPDELNNKISEMTASRTLPWDRNIIGESGQAGVRLRFANDAEQEDINRKFEEALERTTHWDVFKQLRESGD